jgi:hypothetical protein
LDDNEVKKMLKDVSYFHDLMRATFKDAVEAYEALNNYDGDLKYVIASNYLVMAQQSYTELNRVKHESELGHYEVEPFFTAYEEYKFQLKEVITAKDSNTSWLSERYENLFEKWRTTDEFILGYIKTNSKFR